MRGREFSTGVEGHCVKHGATRLDPKTGFCRACNSDKAGRSTQYIKTEPERVERRRKIEAHQERMRLREEGWL